MMSGVFLPIISTSSIERVELKRGRTLGDAGKLRRESGKGERGDDRIIQR